MHRLAEARRRALLKLVPCTLTRDEWLTICEAYGSACAYCGTSERITLDHVWPLTLFGPHSSDNVVPACISCNSQKSDKPLDEARTIAALARNPYVKQNARRYELVVDELFEISDG